MLSLRSIIAVLKLRIIIKTQRKTLLRSIITV
jgi:hypothetical protein